MPSLCALPTEILHTIFVFLPSCSDFYSLNRANKHLHTVSSSPALLRNFSYRLFGPDAIILLANYRSLSFLQSFHTTLINKRFGLSNGMLFGLQTKKHAVGFAHGSDPGGFGKQEILDLCLNHEVLPALDHARGYFKDAWRRGISLPYAGMSCEVLFLLERNHKNCQPNAFWRTAKARFMEDVKKAMYHRAILSCQCHHADAGKGLSFEAGLRNFRYLLNPSDTGEFRWWLRNTRNFQRPKSWGPSDEYDTLSKAILDSDSARVGWYDGVWQYVYDYTFADSLSLNELLRIFALGNESFSQVQFAFRTNLKGFMVAKFVPGTSFNLIGGSDSTLNELESRIRETVEVLETAITYALLWPDSKAAQNAVKTIEGWQEDVDPAYFKQFFEKREVEALNVGGGREKKEILALRSDNSDNWPGMCAFHKGVLQEFAGWDSEIVRIWPTPHLQFTSSCPHWQKGSTTTNSTNWAPGLTI